MADRSSSQERPLILVADDSADVRNLVTTILSLAGFETVTASDGDEVVPLAQLHRPDLIVMDIMMPNMDGYTALVHLRGHPVTKEIPVVMLTGQMAHVYGTLSASVGAVAHVTKPFSRREFTQTVQQSLASARGTA